MSLLVPRAYTGSQSSQVGAHKWTWWFVALAFAILLTIQLAKMVMAENVSLSTLSLSFSQILCAQPSIVVCNGCAWGAARIPQHTCMH